MGRRILRIIYGPEYDLPDNLARLRQRSLGSKRALALCEFALGHEALLRFTERRTLRRVHECVFALLALESEPIDPRACEKYQRKVSNAPIQPRQLVHESLGRTQGGIHCVPSQITIRLSVVRWRTRVWRGGKRMALDREVARFKAIPPEELAANAGRWVVIVGDEVTGFFESFSHAAGHAARRFGRGPYLIREIGAVEVVLPASVVYAIERNAD